MKSAVRKKPRAAVSASDTVIKQVKASLEWESRINLHRHPIRIARQNGDLILEGEAEDIAAKKLALEIAASVRGVGAIVDRLRVAPAEAMGDAQIRDHICKALLEEPVLEGCAISGVAGNKRALVAEIATQAATAIVVEVSDGVVTLNGRVPSLSHKRLAGALAWWVPGCRDVINGLEVVPLEEDNDAELADAVRLVLEKDPLVNAEKIRVGVKDWIVTLEGLVPNETMKKIAERDAWYTIGVRKVENRLEATW